MHRSNWQFYSITSSALRDATPRRRLLNCFSVQSEVETVNRLGVPTSIRRAKLLIYLAVEGSILDLFHNHLYRTVVNPRHALL
jgi:hypothetical protein